MKGKLLLFLFALPFFGVGVWMTWSIGSDLTDFFQMKSWEPQQAQLQSAGYESFSGDDSNTYEAYARYTYQYGGQTYTNESVGIASGADNIGDYQTDTGNRLSSAMNHGESIVVYVNPLDPQDSIIDRSPRWGLLGFKSIFMLVFGGVGLGLMLFVIFGGKSESAKAQNLGPEPWLANDDWQTAVIKSNSKAAMYGTWGFALFWNLISAPLPFLIYGEVLDKNNYLALVGLLFPLVGMGLLTWAIRNTLEWRRFGPAPVNLDPFPGSIGGHVGGTIEVNTPYDQSVKYSLTLTSLHSYVSGSGDKRSRREEAKWQDSQVAHAEHGSKGTRLTFRFDVPESLNESDANPTGDAYDLWRMNLKAELPGTDIDRDYEIPVYATKARSVRLPEFSIRQAEGAQNQIDDVAVRKLVRMSFGPSGRSIVYPAGRNLLSGFIGTIFGAVFGGAGLFMVIEEHSMIMGVAFSTGGGLVLLLSLYSALNSLEVYHDGPSIKTTRRLLGIPIKRCELQRSTFSCFVKRSSMRSQSGRKHVMHYSVSVEDKSGNKIVVGEGLKGDNEADAAIRLIAREFGLPEPDRDAQSDDQYDSENLLEPGG